MTNTLLLKIFTPLQGCLLATSLVGFKIVLGSLYPTTRPPVPWHTAGLGKGKIKKALWKLSHLHVGEETKREGKWNEQEAFPRLLKKILHVSLEGAWSVDVICGHKPPSLQVDTVKRGQHSIHLSPISFLAGIEDLGCPAPKYNNNNNNNNNSSLLRP